MPRSIGQVYITILADSKIFTKQAQQAAKKAGRQSGRLYTQEANKELAKIELEDLYEKAAKRVVANFGDYGKEAGYNFRDGLGDVRLTEAFETEAKEIRKRWREIGERIADDMGLTGKKRKKFIDDWKITTAEAAQNIAANFRGAIDEVERENERAAKQMAADREREERQAAEATLRTQRALIAQRVQAETDAANQRIKDEERLAAEIEETWRESNRIVAETYRDIADEQRNVERENERLARGYRRLGRDVEAQSTEIEKRIGRRVVLWDIEERAVLRLRKGVGTLAFRLRRLGTGGFFTGIGKLTASTLEASTTFGILTYRLGRLIATPITKFTEAAADALSDFAENAANSGGALAKFGPKIAAAIRALGALATGAIAAGVAVAALAALISALYVFMSLLATAISGVVGILTLFAGGLFYAVSALALFVPSIVSLVAAAGALFLAFKDVVPAIGEFYKVLNATDPEERAEALEKYREALEKLSPAAADFVKNLEPIIEALDGIQERVEEAFFEQLTDSVSGLADVVRVAGDGLEKLSAALGGVFERAIEIAQLPETMRDFETLWESSARIVEDLGDGFTDLFFALSSIFAAASPITELFSEAFADTMETFREWAQSAEGQSAIRDFFTDAKEAFDAVWGAIQAVGRALGVLFGAGQEDSQSMLEKIRDLAEQFEEWITRVSEDGTLQQWFDDAIGLAGTIGDLIADAARLFDELDTPENRQFLRDVIDSIGGIVDGLKILFDVVKTTPFVAFFEGVVNALANIDEIIGTIQEAWQGFVDWLSETWESITENVTEAWNAITETISSIWETVWGAITGVVETAVGILTAIWGTIYGILDATIGNALRFIWGFWSRIWTIMLIPVRVAIGIVIYLWQQLWAGAKFIFNAIWNAIRTPLQIAWDFIRGLWTGAQQWLAQMWGNILNGVSRAWNAVYNTISGFVSAIWNGIVSVWGGISNWLSNNVWGPIQRGWDSLKSGLSSAWEGIKGLFRSGIDFIKTQVNKIIDAVNFVIRAANKLPGPDIPEVTRLAAGAIVTSPTFAQIGEAGPEAVVPLTRPLHLVNPEVRDLARLARGENIPGGGGSVVSKTVNQYITPVAADPEAVADSVLNRLALEVDA